MTSIHGHDVMQMMLENEQAFSKESLREAIETRFGAQARFHTCSASDMSAEELIVFLEKKGKFVEQGTGFSTQADKICDH